MYKLFNSNNNLEYDLQKKQSMHITNFNNELSLELVLEQINSS